MSRTDDDSWDLASSVGATATMVAAGRAMATKDPKGLINDPYADPLVRAVGLDFFTKMMDGELDFSLPRTRRRTGRRQSSTGWVFVPSTLTSICSPRYRRAYGKW